MNRLSQRPWFFPSLGAMLYLIGFNDALLHWVASGWLKLGRGVQVVAVVFVLAIITYLVVDYVRERRSAYRTAVRAAAVNDARASNVEGLAKQL